MLARRERHRRRPLVVRVLAGAAGAVLGVVGAVPLPEAGLPLLLAGVALLALEFDWAVRAYARVLQPCRPPAGAAAALAGLVALGVGLFAWLH